MTEEVEEFRPQRILLLEDNQSFAMVVQDTLLARCGVIVVNVSDADQAFGFVRGNVGFSAIVVDGDLGRGVEEMVAFVKRVAPIFPNPIIACSASPESSARLRRAGCTHATEEKHELPELLIELLMI
jgi:CheY-like chemotaxis protein